MGEIVCFGKLVDEGKKVQEASGMKVIDLTFKEKFKPTIEM